MPREQGYVGRVVSLAGVVGMEGRGRESYNDLIPMVGSTGRLILTSNSRRISAIIQNRIAGDLYITLGEEYNGLGIVLFQNQSLQIDRDFPWTGDIRGFSLTSGNVGVIEISII